MLHVHTSQRAEALADRLGAMIARPAGPALRPEPIAVHSRGLGRWLTLRLADRLGIAANLRFAPPGELLSDAYRAVLGDLPHGEVFEPGPLEWRIARALDEVPRSGVFAPLHRYVERLDPAGRHRLAVALAEMFDRYLLLRPEWISEWEAGSPPANDPAAWVGALWHRLASEEPGDHTVRARRAFLERLEHDAASASKLADRWIVFGVPALAPAWLEAYRAIARHRDVHLFQVVPSLAWTGDSGAREHPIVLSMGRVGRDLFDALSALPEETVRIEAVPETAARETPGTALGALQREIVTGHSDARATTTGDRSLQWHACHSPAREIEVLHDRLLDLLANDRSLRASDIVVMTPDIDRYAPYVEAVFSTATPAIPFAIADRAVRDDRPAVEATLALLDVADSRLEADRVLDLLESPLVRERFGLEPADLVLIHRWTRGTGIRWGIDGRHRASLELPAIDEHTWSAGLDRLLLGYAMRGDGVRRFEDVLPYDDLEGADARVAGRFRAFFRSLVEAREAVAVARTPHAWGRVLLDLVERGLAPRDESDQEDLQHVRTTVERLVRHAAIAGFDREIPLAVVRAELERTIGTRPDAGHFLRRGVTFCRMVPMRSVPFRVVCLVGLDGDRFPRVRHLPSFDRMRSDPRPGDRPTRDDDRYLFLEAALAARDALVLSCVGRSVRDDQALPASVVLDELAEATCGTLRRLDHPLQAFSPEYFEPAESDALFSYRAELVRAGAWTGRGDRRSRPLVETPLEPPEDVADAVRLDDLAAFVGNPARALLTRRLRVHVNWDEEALSHREPFVVDALERYRLGERMLELEMRVPPPSRPERLAALRASGLLPHGVAGELKFDDEQETIVEFAQRVRALETAAPGGTIEIDLALGDERLIGRLSGVRSRGLVEHRYGRVRAKDRLETWIRHLALNAAGADGFEARSAFVGVERARRGKRRGQRVPDGFRYEPLERDRARELLAMLVGLYRCGLREALPLLPESGYAFVTQARKLAKPKSRASKPAIEAARDAWSPHRGERSFYEKEGEREEYKILFRGTDPFDERFEAISNAVFEPLLDTSVDGVPS